jgi:hypothetical protein
VPGAKPCNCREDFLDLDAGECLIDAVMRTRAENRMPSEMVLAEDIEVVGIGIDQWIAQSRGHGNGEQSTGGNSIAVQIKSPDNDTGDSMITGSKRNPSSTAARLRPSGSAQKARH